MHVLKQTQDKAAAKPQRERKKSEAKKKDKKKAVTDGKSETVVRIEHLNYKVCGTTSSSLYQSNIE